MNFSSTLGLLRIVGFLEGCSFLLFGLTMPLKYIWATPLPNYIIGIAHGVLFMTYILLVFIVARGKKFTLPQELWAYVASLLPFGTFVADAKIFRKYS